MNVIPKKEEMLLEHIIKKYDGNDEMSVSGTYEELPKCMKFDIKDIIKNLEYCGYIGKYIPTLYNWEIILNPEGLEYFEKKGMREELFEELAENEKELLKEIIELENKDDNINIFIENKLEDDKKDIIKGIIKVLDSNGLIKVFWASNMPCRVSLTNPGRTYFEREKKYLKRMNSDKNNVINFGDVKVDGGNFIVGDVNNSTLNIDNHITKIEEDIAEKSDEKDEESLKEILEETKEILDNIKNSGAIGQRKSFFNKLTNHACKYGWFYSEIVNLIGTAIIKKIGGM